MKEFVILEAKYNNGQTKTLLVLLELYVDEGERAEDFFPPTCIDVKELGRVQMTGDVDELESDTYLADD